MSFLQMRALKVMGTVLNWLYQTFCSLRGHDELLEFEERRMFLKCASCGHQSPGWQVGKTAPLRPLSGTRPADRVRPPAPRFAREHQTA